MASNSFLYSLCILLLILLHTCPTSSRPTPPHHLAFEPTENSSMVVIDVERITKTLWDAGYRIMSLILEKDLHSVIPYGRVGYSAKNTVDIYNNNTVTIFVPPDEVVRFENWIILAYQAVTSKVNKEDFDSGSLSKGSVLLTCDWKDNLVVSDVPSDGYPSINNVKITQWNIYNDGHIIVHGVEDFFEGKL